MIRNKRRAPKLKKKRNQKGSGGINPIFVDSKEGVKVMGDLIKAFKKPVNNVNQAKRTVAGYIQKYQATKSSSCCLM